MSTTADRYAAARDLFATIDLTGDGSYTPAHRASHDAVPYFEVAYSHNMVRLSAPLAETVAEILERGVNINLDALRLAIRVNSDMDEATIEAILDRARILAA